ncbi:MAG: carboxypeptidase-like regulatory domain-containing protein, partial [Gemmatimonadota bacterium]|nr:carboxypeptidase-like regulatory domain-containing protein [Gemmatimonadota bacterium]
MNHHVRKLFPVYGIAGALLLSIASAIQAQDAGTITGRVTDAASSGPVPSAQVQIVGTTRGAVTGDDGRFRIVGIRAAQYQVRVLRLGYQASVQTVNVPVGGTADANFSLAPAAVSLEEVVTTATGERERKREIGSAVSTLQPQSEQIASAQNLSQLLTGKVPGVDIQQAGGTVGAGSRIRIRGAASISLTNEPLVVVDGIRFNNSIGNSATTGST